MFPKVFLKKKEESRIINGHLWVFSNEIDRYESDVKNGDLVEVYSNAKEFLGQGLVNKNSLIAIRILTQGHEKIDKDFFIQHIKDAYQFRQKIYPHENSYRMVYGESDFLPGLIIDKYENFLVLQVLSLGMEQRIELIADALEEIFHPRGIYLRNDVEARKLEGMELIKGVIKGQEPPQDLVIEQNGLEYKVDIVNGQKTGFFFDQRDNREALKDYVKGKSFLDCFCYNGGFALTAAKYQAAQVTGVDISQEAISKCGENAKLNNLQANCDFMVADVFDFLQECINKNKKYDVINVDPPAFTKTKKTLPQAIKGYIKLNSLALQIVNSGGILISSSCSHYIDNQTFVDILKKSAAKAKRTLRLIEFRGQAKDHPILLAMPETSYLKCAIMEVL